MTLNIPVYYESVSLRLNRVLDAVGLGEDIRWKRINMWIQTEEIMSCRSRYGVHLLGSQAEATTTIGLVSDIDVVKCMGFTAIQDLESWVPDMSLVIALSDENTPPGYVKLQGVYKDKPLAIYDKHNEVYKLDGSNRSIFCNDNGYLKQVSEEYHGPARTVSYRTIITLDLVPAIRLHAWPDQASRWLTRNRRHNWPSKEKIDLIQETGALLVPVGHKFSQEKRLEWRLSISYGEKLLVWLFNSTQYKCYILLKMINKHFIKPVVGDDVLSSYHCKTCVFYLIENTPTTMWQTENLLLCVELCLRLLYTWVDCKTCPNYFIPEENMFQCKVYSHVQRLLLGVLSDLLRQEGRYLIGISFDNIGQELMMTCQPLLAEHESQNQDVMYYMQFSFKYLLQNIDMSRMVAAVGTDVIIEPGALERVFFSQEPRREACAILWKFYCSIIGSKLASESLSKESTDQHDLELAHEFLLLGSTSDVASGKLKLAAFYLVQNNLDMSEDVLNEIQENYSNKISDNVFFQHLFSRHTLRSILSENVSTTQVIRDCVACAVIYHRSEINCAPKALIPEMFRYIGSAPADQHKKFMDKNFFWLDAKFYLYFLKFQCHHQQKKKLRKKASLCIMILVICYEHLEFKDTALNLLAYCLKQEGRLMNSCNVLCKSMKLKQKRHNAAKWHIASLIHTVFRCLRGGQ